MTHYVDMRDMYLYEPELTIFDERKTFYAVIATVHKRKYSCNAGSL